MTGDSICAPATAPVNSSIAVIRMSGPETLGALRSLFSRFEHISPWRAVYGSIIDGGSVVDDVLVTYFKSPRSFTGEDMAEIYCHGNPLLVGRILKLLHRSGVRLAEPGEFSKRAFLNGKIDLTEAEAINHIVTARNEWEIEASLKQMHGSFREMINRVREDLLELKADIECGIDFPDEDIDFVSQEQAAGKSEAVRQSLDEALRRCRIGERISRGIDIPIVGKPNVGKSSILNLVLNAERAIVSDIPGTTRDIIREDVRLGGMHINLIDTAGIGDQSGEIERRGMELSRSKIESSSLVLTVLDVTTGVQDADRMVLSQTAGRKRIVIVNKIDLASPGQLEEMLSALDGRVVPLSARTGEGLGRLEEEITGLLRSEFVDYRDFFVADMRMMRLMEDALNAVAGVRRLIEMKEPPEIIAFELQAVIDALSEITGQITPDDVLNSIFSRFCIGK
jgi:tRNA modification GTPase